MNSARPVQRVDAWGSNLNTAIRNVGRDEFPATAATVDDQVKRLQTLGAPVVMTMTRNSSASPNSMKISKTILPMMPNLKSNFRP